MIARVLASFKYAFRGLFYAIRTERNMRFHIMAGCLVIVAAIIIGVEFWEMAVLVIAVTIVKTAELINSSMEQLIDLHTDGYDEKAKNAKDMAAAAVLIAAFGAVFVALIVFGSRLFSIF